MKSRGMRLAAVTLDSTLDRGLAHIIDHKSPRWLYLEKIVTFENDQGADDKRDAEENQTQRAEAGAIGAAGPPIALEGAA